MASESEVVIYNGYKIHIDINICNPELKTAIFYKWCFSDIVFIS